MRHLNGFLVRILRRHRQRNIRITYLLHHTHARKARAEVGQLLDEEGESIEEREQLLAKIRFIGLAPTQALLDTPEYQKLLLGSTTSIRFGMELQSAFGHVWVNILTSSQRDRMLRCAATGQDYSFDAWPRPTILHTDIYGAPIIKFVGEQDLVKGWHTKTIYHWSTEFVSFWRMFRKDSFSQGGIEDEVRALLDDPRSAAALPDDASFVELCWERYNHNANKLLHYPGLRHGMYDYEIHPGQVGWLRTYIPALNRMKSAVVEADGVVVASCEAFQPNAKALVQQWLEQEIGTRLFAIGPAIEDNLLADQPINLLVHEKDAATIAFLDRCQDRFGERSVILLSWGTIWAPFRYPDILEAWIDEVLASGRPFILNRSAELFSRLSPWIEEKLKLAAEQDNCFQTTWIAQRTVLRHPAMGIFVSHCGFSSASESTVPIIGWPSFFDQSINAQLQVENDCGWQLYQVRGPDAAKQGHKCRMLELQGKAIIGTLDAVRQEARQVLEESHREHSVYKRKAANLAELKRSLRACMAPGGDAYNALEELVEMA